LTELSNIPLSDLALIVSGLAGAYPVTMLVRQLHMDHGSTPKEPKDKTAIDFLPDADEIELSPIPGAARFTLYLLVAALLSFLVWANIFKVDQVVVARGRLVTPLPNIVVQPLETAILQSIDVRVGQVVKKGERLATLDPTFSHADEAELRNRYESLETQSQRLQAEIAGAKVSVSAGSTPDEQLQAKLSAERAANYRAQLRRMEESIGRLRASIETNRRDQSAQEARLASLREIESMQDRLVRQQVGAKINLLEAQDRRIEAERALSIAANRDVELRRELGAAIADRDAFEKSWRQKAMEELLATSRDRDAVKEQLAKADKRSSMVTLVAPSDAVVLEIGQKSQGSVVQGGEMIFTLVPLAENLEAEVRIDSSDVGYVKTGHKTHLKVDAFPFQLHGTIEGEVRTISEDAFRREGGGGVDGYYASRIKFDGSQLKNVPPQSRLLPGMTVSGEIVVGRRTVMSYLLWPLTKAFNESLREP
jgi:HlyD family secretion protein